VFTGGGTRSMEKWWGTNRFSKLTGLSAEHTTNNKTKQILFKLCGVSRAQ